jgi:YebC/PmpR family DNA-binding regulatory protein
MSGHSKWSTIKHKKAATDAKRGKIFTKLIKEITIAAKTGGGIIDSNPRLRTAIQTAKANNMPAENIDRAIKKGTGELEGVSYEELTYEGYGPEGVAILVQCLTDNKNRTAAEIRSIFNKGGGSMAGAGSVAWGFESKGAVLVNVSDTTEEKLFEIAIGAGAEDIVEEAEKFTVTTGPQDLYAVRDAIEQAGIKVDSAELTMIPKNEAPVSVDSARKVIGLIETFEDHDDVQHVYANCDIPDEVMKELSE